MRWIFLVCLNISLCAQVFSQNVHIMAIRDSMFSGSKHMSDKALMAELQDSVVQLYKNNINDQYAIVALRYYLYSVKEVNTISDSVIRVAESLIALQEASTVEKNPVYYYYFASCYNTIGLLARQQNNFYQAKASFIKGITASEIGITLDRRQKKSILSSLLLIKSAILNNVGNLIYQSTSHKDPIEKRNEVGPIIERYWLEADSIQHVIGKMSPDGNCSSVISEISQNLLLLYGYYYPNQVKAKFYYDKTIEYSTRCNNAEVIDRLDLVLGWIRFCKEDFRAGTPYFIRYLKRFQNEKTSQIQDARYALVESYYYLGQADSVIYYGNSYFQDTAFTKDYLFLAMASTYMTEMYIKKGDIYKARKLLSLTKEFTSKSQHEAILSEYKREGTQIILDTAIARIAKLSETMENRDRRDYNLKLIALVLILILSLMSGYIFIKRLWGRKLSQ